MKGNGKRHLCDGPGGGAGRGRGRGERDRRRGGAGQEAERAGTEGGVGRDRRRGGRDRGRGGGAAKVLETDAVTQNRRFFLICDLIYPLWGLSLSLVLFVLFSVIYFVEVFLLLLLKPIRTI